MKLTVITDMDFLGSGYFNISTYLCAGLSMLGHQVRVLGLSYKREEHQFPFSILPAAGFGDVVGMFHNLVHLDKPDALIVALDIPHQRRLINEFQRYGIPHIGIMAIESDPLCFSWAMSLMQTKQAFIISDFGTKEAQAVGVPAQHFQVGIDANDNWKMRKPEDRATVREPLGIEQDEFVVLTVADNQERKHLSRSMQIMAEFGKRNPDVKYRYLMVTREHFFAGWELRDLARQYGISDRVLIFERGMPLKELWSLFAASDAFLLTSKADGLGLPVMEAQAVGIPVVGTNCTGIAEQLRDGRGYLIDYDYVYTDPYGNGRRYFASLEHGVQQIEKVYRKEGTVEVVKSARKYVEGKTWDIPINLVNETLRRIENEQKEQAQHQPELTVL